ncbi:hypothetical protein HD806DRAFT_508182 [Xylariaceae sp. AK1471]|nr:hypothetical protein HD806DRAFT_508182 [Xylariaceae sp. AK1471]
MTTTRTNLGPFTSGSWTYTCTEVIQACSDCDHGWAAQTCIGQGTTVTDNQKCWPPRATKVPKTSGALVGWGIYSPGLLCPDGFTSVVGATHGGSSNFDFQFPLTAGETAIGCCPKGGFSAIRDINNKGQTCVQFQPTTSFLVGTCGSDGGPTYTPFSIGGTLNSGQLKSFSVNAPMLQVVHQASDLLAGYTSISSKSSSDALSRTGTGHSDGNIEGNNQNPGLSAGAIAGIAIGAVLGAILAATFAFCVWRARWRKRSDADLPLGSPNSRFKDEFDNAIFRRAVEADDTQVKTHVEMSVEPQWRYDGAELPGGVVEINSNQPVELGSQPITKDYLP